jgi:CHAT domain-containing protein
MRHLFLAVLCIFSLSQVNTHAQPSPAHKAIQVANEEREFDRAVERYREDFTRLKGARAAVPRDDARVSQFKESLPQLSLSDVARIVGEDFPQDTAILFYDDDEDGHLRAWLIDKLGIKGFSQSNVAPEQIRSTVAGLRDALDIERLQRARKPQIRDLALADKPPAAARQSINIDQAIANLTRLLLPADIATALPQVKNLIVVPVLDIGTVPFAVLQPFGTKAMLIDRMSISVAPSLFDITLERPAPWSAKFDNPLIVGNPRFTDKSKWKIPNLPGAEDEAKAIASALDAKPLIGPAATKEVVLQRVVDADLLYFATHAVGDTQNSRNNSFLVFGFTENDLGFWTMAEILDAHQKWGVMSGPSKKTPLKARLAILSACQTGVGEVWKGGVMSLGRTIQSAGVPRVVMSLWNVSDAATVDLMRSYVSHLGKDIPAEALRKAMLDTRENHPSPAQWAAFVYFGLPY